MSADIIVSAVPAGNAGANAAGASAADNGYIVRFRDAGELRFGFDEVMEYALYEEGRTVDVRSVCLNVLTARMKRSILPYCALSKRTEKQILDRLDSAFSESGEYGGFWTGVLEDAKRGTLEYLIAEGYAGDDRYCAAYIKSCQGRNVSEKYIVYELVRRGIPQETAERAAAEADTDDAAACRRALEKKLRTSMPELYAGGTPDARQRAALVRFLLSKGFETGLAIRTVDNYTGADE